MTIRAVSSLFAAVAATTAAAVVAFAPVTVLAVETPTRSLAEIDARLKVLNPQIEAQKAQVVETATSRPPSWWSTTNAMTISSVVLLFGFLVLVLAFISVQAGRQPEAVLRIFGTILVIITAVFLVVAGYSDKQIAPVMGLLGTIVGYLLGKDSPASRDSKSDQDTQRTT